MSRGRAKPSAVPIGPFRPCRARSTNCADILRRALHALTANRERALPSGRVTVAESPIRSAFTRSFGMENGFEGTPFQNRPPRPETRGADERGSAVDVAGVAGPAGDVAEALDGAALDEDAVVLAAAARQPAVAVLRNARAGFGFRQDRGEEAVGRRVDHSHSRSLLWRGPNRIPRGFFG